MNLSFLFKPPPDNSARERYCDEGKRQANLAKHGLDFADGEKVFAGPLVLIEDSRHEYGEQRMIGIGLLDFLVVLIVHVEADDEIRVRGWAVSSSSHNILWFAAGTLPGAS